MITNYIGNFIDINLGQLDKAEINVMLNFYLFLLKPKLTRNDKFKLNKTRYTFKEVCYMCGTAT